MKETDINVLLGFMPDCVGDEEDNQFVKAVQDIAIALRNLGNADASTRMGAIENLSKEIQEAGYRINSGLVEIANAIRECTK